MRPHRHRLPPKQTKSTARTTTAWTRGRRRTWNATNTVNFRGKDRWRKVPTLQCGNEFFCVRYCVGQNTVCFTYSFSHAFSHYFLHSLRRALANSYFHSFTHSFIYTFIHSFIYTFIHSFVHSSCSFIWSLIQSFLVWETRCVNHCVVCVCRRERERERVLQQLYVWVRDGLNHRACVWAIVVRWAGERVCE